jgi:hypothetical protein
VLQLKPVAHMKQRERPLPVLTLLFAVPNVVSSASKRTITWITGRRPTHNCFRLDQKYFYKVIFMGRISRTYGRFGKIRILPVPPALAGFSKELMTTKDTTDREGGPECRKHCSSSRSADLNSQLLQLCLADRRWRVDHQVHSPGCFREGNDFAQAICAREDHDDAIEP